MFFLMAVSAAFPCLAEQRQRNQNVTWLIVANICNMYTYHIIMLYTWNYNVVNALIKNQQQRNPAENCNMLLHVLWTKQNREAGFLRKEPEILNNANNTRLRSSEAHALCFSPDYWKRLVNNELPSCSEMNGLLMSSLLTWGPSTGGRDTHTQWPGLCSDQQHRLTTSPPTVTTI